MRTGPQPQSTDDVESPGLKARTQALIDETESLLRENAEMRAGIELGNAKKGDVPGKFLECFAELQRLGDLFWTPDEEPQAKVAAARAELETAKRKCEEAVLAVQKVRARIDKAIAAKKSLDEQIKVTDPEARDQLGKLVHERNIETGTSEALQVHLASASEALRVAQDEALRTSTLLLEAEKAAAEDEVRTVNSRLMDVANRAVEQVAHLRAQLGVKLNAARSRDYELRQAKGLPMENTGDTSFGTVWGAVPEHLGHADAIAHAVRNSRDRAEAHRRWEQQTADDRARAAAAPGPARRRGQRLVTSTPALSSDEGSDGG
jgi:hypothetical protein